MHVWDFSELKNTEVSATLLKNDSTADALPAILKIFQLNKGNTYGGVSFRYSYTYSYSYIVIGQLEFFKKRYWRRFFGNFQNFRSISFSNILSKMYEEIFLETFS